MRSLPRQLRLTFSPEPSISNAMANRLLPPDQIPTLLWRRPTSELSLPMSLSNAYRQVLTTRNWLEEALAGGAGGAIGGAKSDATKRHFVESFAGSCARVELVALDPHETLEAASDRMVRAFAGGRLGVLDIPCGAGAAALSLLCVMAVLRSEDRLPRQPLDVFLVGGDNSDTARSLASEMKAELVTALEEQGIRLHSQFLPWDVCDAQSTTELLHAWMEHARDCRRYLVVAANCSGFLQSEGKFEAAKPQLEQVFRWAKARRSDVVWVEPQTNKARLNFLPRLMQWFRHVVPGLFRILAGGEGNPGLLAEAKCAHPLKSGAFRVHLSLVRFEHNDGGDG